VEKDLSSNVRLLNTEQAINLLGCSKHAFKGYLARGSLYPCKKAGGRNLFSEESIKNFTRPMQSNALNRKFPHKKSSAPADMKDVINKWRTSSHDTSSADVQIGIYTERIQQLEMDMKGVSYDDPLFANMRSLLIKCVFERRRLLNYLQVSDYVRYRRAMAFIESDRVAS
jgi:ribosomal protein S15